jgi:uncharacterized protein
MAIIVKRLKPGNDLRLELEKLALDHHLVAGVVLSMVGSLREANLRFADHDTGTVILGPLEIVSVTGTICTAGLHVHIAVSDRHGRTVGGHMLEGCYVFTTCEVVMMNVSAEWKYDQDFDENSCSHTLRELKATIPDKKKAHHPGPADAK